jgi:hypothetical protein
MVPLQALEYDAWSPLQNVINTNTMEEAPTCTSSLIFCFDLSPCAHQRCGPKNRPPMIGALLPFMYIDHV